MKKQHLKINEYNIQYSLRLESKKEIFFHTNLQV